jgi:tripeptide aminopeptidase
VKGLDAHLSKEVRDRFLRYVRVNTRSDPESGARPSSEGQWDLARMLAGELRDLGLEEVELDEGCFLYARLPGSTEGDGTAICLCAHLDTSPSEPGDEVIPVLHEGYQGGPIRFSDDPDLVLSPELSPELRGCIGHTLVTASGRTLLGADDKAGIAEIMAALSALRRFADLPRPELRIVFTPDEEIGQGTLGIDVERLAPAGYTVDGGDLGVIEEECFTAHEARVFFTGRNVHPGYAKDRMINAGAAAARFAAALPEHDVPEHAEGREGFLHLTDLQGRENEARLTYILRDFEEENNRKRIDLLENLAGLFRQRHPGLGVRVEVREQYRNMKQALERHPEVVARAVQAVEAAGLRAVKKPIRGGTDGARLSFMGMSCPNLFSGAMLPHSRTEWVSETVMQKAAETLVRLCGLWSSG